MRPVLLLATALSFALAPGCICKSEPQQRDAGPGLDGSALDAAIIVDAALADAAADSAALPDAALDAMPDAMADAMVCLGSGDTATHREPTPPTLWPALTSDSAGAVAAYSGASNTTLVRVDASGQRRTADVVLALPEVAALAFDGTDYVVAGRVGQTIQLRRVTSAGVVGSPITIGTGQVVLGALAVHASGDVALLWRGQLDGALRVTVVPTTGAAVDTVLHTPPTITNSQPVGGIIATTSATAKFLVAYQVVASSLSTTVAVRPIAPDGAQQLVSTGAATVRERVGLAPGASPDTAIVTWRDQGNSDPWVAMVDATGATTLAPRVVFTRATGDFVTRVASRAIPGGGFDVLVDNYHGVNNRAVERYSFDATGAPTTNARLATVCTGTNEENLPFTRTGSTRFATWDNGSASLLITF
ncbi:MAG: hypothetical protein IT370_03085 [Deltaproteobacteria bacterium]|nr:hypothetical protein [Deltaproteobacteria bacterium]